MKKKMINLLLIGVIFVFVLIFLSSNIHELFSPFNNKNNSTDIADISKEDIFGTNFKNDENIENNSKEDDIENNHIEYTPKKDIPIVNGKVLSDIYSIDIVNYNIMKDFYGWTDDESLLNYYMFENSILFHTRQDGKYEIIPESMSPTKPSDDIYITFKCRDFYTKEEAFEIIYNISGRVIANKIK